MDTYAVIFTSQRNEKDSAGYERMSELMVEAAKKQPGFLRVESLRNSGGFGITISYWDSLDAIKNWKEHSEHLKAQKAGKENWYDSFKVEICKIEKEYSSS